MNSPTIDDVPQSLAAAWEIHERLVYFSQPGRLLAGLKVHNEISKSAQGESDLPCIMPIDSSWEEEIFAGQSRINSREAKNTTQMATVEIRYRAHFSRRAGLVRRNFLNASERRGMLEWQALIMDALERERSTQFKPDSSLLNTSFKPIEMEWVLSDPNELSIASDLAIRVFPVFCRAERGHLRNCT